MTTIGAALAQLRAATVACLRITPTMSQAEIGRIQRQAARAVSALDTALDDATATTKERREMPQIIAAFDDALAQVLFNLPEKTTQANRQAIDDRHL